METINDLYWHGADTVAELLERLDITRSELYAAIEPLPTGERCAECGGTLVYSNRSARSADRATCLGCGLARPDRRETGADESHDAFGKEPAQAAGGMDHRVSVLHQPWVRERNQRMYLVGGAAVLGAALGAAAVVLARRN